MLFRKTLIQEMTWVALAVFAVLLLLVMTTQVVRLLGQEPSARWPRPQSGH